METISILGCGWLGLPLADYLIGKGYELKGSTEDPERARSNQSPRYRAILSGPRSRAQGRMLSMNFLIATCSWSIFLPRGGTTSPIIIRPR